MSHELPTELASAAPPALPTNPQPSVEQVRALQSRLVASGAAVNLDGLLRHHFAPGMYGRECPIPAGMVVVGKQHRHAHLTLLLSGAATINTDRGMETITGPHIWTSTPGAKRALVTHSDCVFFTVHLNPDDTTDLAVIEADTILPEPVPVLESAPAFADYLQEMYA